MVSNNDLPEGWSMPDDMAKRIIELVNKKPYAPEDDLQDALDDMARDIALIDPNPVNWGGWFTYLMNKWKRKPGNEGTD